MNQTRLDRYSGYLTATFGYATATGLSQLLDGSISHDAVSRFLSEREYTPKDLWKQVKRTVREIESADGVLVFDDTVQEKPHMDENDLICWHYDHCQGRDIKGVNLELPVSQQGCIHPWVELKEPPIDELTDDFIVDFGWP